VPVFRISAADGRTRTVTAGRVVVVDDEVRFQSSNGDAWTAVAVAPVAEVRAVQRRFNEADGRLRWVDERDVCAELARQPADEAPEGAAATAPAPAAPAGAAAVAPARAATTPPPVVSAREVRCPSCGEDEELSGRRTDGDIEITCHRCGYVGPRVAGRRCPTCGGADVVDRPQAMVERSRGTQLSIVGYTTVGLCRSCDADELEYSQQHNAGVLPKELPTVDPATLDELRPGSPPR
jgi:hypothetical protein